MSLGFTDILYLPKRPIAKAFANASWQQRAIANIVTLRKHGWRGANLQPHFEAVTEVETVAEKCLKKGDWLLDHIKEELAFMRANPALPLLTILITPSVTSAPVMVCAFCWLKPSHNFAASR